MLLADKFGSAIVRSRCSSCRDRWVVGGCWVISPLMESASMGQGSGSAWHKALPRYSDDLQFFLKHSVSTIVTSGLSGLPHLLRGLASFT